MNHSDQFFIDGEWVSPDAGVAFDVINPANETVVAQISLGNSKDVDKAVAAAKAAFPAYSQTSREERLDLLGAIVSAYKARYSDMADAISTEMGAPTKLATQSQAACGIGHLSTARNVLKDYPFSHRIGNSQILREPVGVCGFITPWNWPVNQIACKVAPALATGCTMVLKPSEVAPLSAIVFAEILESAGVPKGVFNMIQGDGAGVGASLSSHPDVDMVSFTGSTRAGVLVAKAAADTVKRVAQELGGKSANIILDDADLESAVKQGVRECFSNSGQSCNAPTRMLVPQAKLEQAATIAKAVAEKTVVGDPRAEGTHLGPVVSQLQFDRIQTLIEKGIAEGAELIAGGPGKPDGLSEGYYVKPTVFSGVNNDMTIAREEVFGPVLCILPYANEDEAVDIANDTVYGLSGYVQSASAEHAQEIATRLRTGMVHINGASGDFDAPFGGYKQSGNGREWGEYAFEDFLETKAIMGGPA